MPSPTSAYAVDDRKNLSREEKINRRDEVLATLRLLGGEASPQQIADLTGLAVGAVTVCARQWPSYLICRDKDHRSYCPGKIRADIIEIHPHLRQWGAA